MTQSPKERKPISEQVIQFWLKESKHRRGLHGERLDSNGYSESLVSHDEECFLCGWQGDLARHEAFGGADRQTSKAVGCWCLLCPRCHEKVHKRESWARTLHQQVQAIYELNYSHEEFMALFGRNYL